MIYRSANPECDADRYDMEAAEIESSYPVCEICGDYITDEDYRFIGNECFHDKCIGTASTETYRQNRGGDDYV